MGKQLTRTVYRLNGPYINNFFKINSYTINDNMYTMTTSCADKIYTVEVELKACFENCTN